MKSCLTLGVLMAATTLLAAEHSLDYCSAKAKNSTSSIRAEAVGVDRVMRETILTAAEVPTAAAPIAVGDKLRLRLFPQTEVEVRVVRELPGVAIGRSFLAAVGESDVCSAVILQTGGRLQMHLKDLSSGRTFVVSATAKGGIVREVKPRPVGCSSDTLSPVGPPLALPHQEEAGARPMNTATMTHVDLLLVYDTPAANWAMENGYGLLEFAQMQTDKMNAALRNTYLTDALTFRLKGVRLLDGSLGASTGNAVQYVRWGINLNGVETSPVHTWRDEVGADVVCVMIDTGSDSGTTGTGYPLTDYSSPASFASSAYNVTAIRALVGSHTMTHEVGHNMGAGHADAMADMENRGPQSYPYSSGYYYTGTDGNAYYTIMAYNTDGYGNYYTEAPYFSSPYYYYKGHAVGDETHNNTQVLRNLASAVAAFRAEKPVTPEDIVLYNVFFSPGDASVINGTLSVSLKSAMETAEIRYTTDGSTPTATSRKYSSPIRLSATTTVKAVCFVNGVSGPVYQATYYLNDLGEGIDAPELEWTTDERYPWQFAVDKTHDGQDAVCSGGIGGWGTSHLRTTVIGPGTLHFYYCKSFYSASFEVRSDDDVVYSDTESTSAANTAWNEVSLSIGSGEHALDFSYTHNGTGWSGVFNGVHLDQLSWSGNVPCGIRLLPGVGTGSARTLVFEPGRVYSLPANPFTPPAGKRFAGWAGSNGRRYDDQMLVFNLGTSNTVVTLTAIWE